MVLLVGVFLGVASTAAIHYLLYWFAQSADRSMLELLGSSLQLRLLLFLQFIVLVLFVAGVVVSSRVKSRSRLTLRADAIEYSVPSVPLWNPGGTQLVLTPGAVDSLRVQRVFRYLGQRVELIIGSGRDEIRVPLEHCDGGPGLRGRRLPDRSQWENHFLLVELTQLTGKPVTRI